jgi:hypothetical protein
MAKGGEEQQMVFQFPIQESNKELRMKNINPFVLSRLHGLTIEDPENFLFEFELYCRT